MMRFTRLLAVFAALLFSWPTATSIAREKHVNASSDSLGAQSTRLSPAAGEVARVRDQWAQFLNSKQIGPLMTLYASDAVFLQPTGARINGAPSIRAMTQKIWGALTPSITMHGVTTKVSCDMAYDDGDFHETLTSVSGGAKQQTQGQYLMVFKRDAHGKWLIVEQVWTGAEPKH
jgi:ketosteroid isomerase-like protein